MPIDHIHKIFRLYPNSERVQALTYDGPDVTLFIYTLMSVKQKELV